jgi:hypothetical protein
MFCGQCGKNLSDDDKDQAFRWLNIRFTHPAMPVTFVKCSAAAAVTTCTRSIC